MLMKTDYWDVSDEQVVEKTGKGIGYWMEVLEGFGARDKKSNDVVGYLQTEHGVARYWARTLVTNFLKKGEV